MIFWKQALPSKGGACHQDLPLRNTISCSKQRHLLQILFAFHKETIYLVELHMFLK